MNEVKTDDYWIMNGDCVQLIDRIPDESVHFSIFSPPFAELYVYSDLPEDMGNCSSYDEFFEHFSFLLPGLNRIMIPGRIVGVHCMFIPLQKGKDGILGFRNFPAGIQKVFEENGFILHGPPTTIWKDPVVEMQRTKAIGLLNKQKDKDASYSRTGNPDFIYWFRKLGDNPIPVKHTSTDKSDPNYIPIDLWQKYASPVWYDINYSDTLQFRTAKENNDEKHIAPLQLETIKRAIHLYTNIGEKIFTPFMGIGSEPYQALKMDRKAIGIELKRSYYDVAKRNCYNAVESQKQLQLF